MLSCPIESSDEWKKTLESTNGDREAALAIWRADETLSKDVNLNEKVDNDTFADERDGEPDPIEEPKSENPFDKLIENIKVFLAKQYQILSRKMVSNQSGKLDELQKVIDAFTALEGVESINMFIKDAYQNSERVINRFNRIIGNKDLKTRKELIKELSDVNEFVNGYSILNEISKKDIYKFFSEPVDPSIPANELTPQQMLSRAIEVRRVVNEQFIEIGIPLMAEFLSEYQSGYSTENIAEEVNRVQGKMDIVKKDPALSDEQRAKEVTKLQEELDKYQKYSLDVKGLEDILRSASTDASVFDFLISPLVSSEDAALALFGIAIKSQLEIARQKDIKLRNEWNVDFENYAATTSASRDNKAEFNKGIYEFIKYSYRNKKGEVVNVDTAGLVQKYDLASYRNEEFKFKESMGDPPIAVDPLNPTRKEESKMNQYAKKIGIWYSQNKKPKSEKEIDDIINAKKKEVYNRLITQKEYDVWEADRIHKNEQWGTITYRKELSQPADKYLNPKWKAMYDVNDNPINAKGKLHQTYVKIMMDAQELLPESQRIGFRLPSIPKSDLERVMTNGLVSTIQENIKDATEVRDIDSTQFGIANTSQLGVKFIPIHYTQQMSAEDISLDLGKSILEFAAMAHKYSALNEVNGEISLFKSIISKEGRVIETDENGRGILDVFANALGYQEFIKKNGESYSQKHVDAFINMIVNGETQVNETLFGISSTKVTNTLSAFSALTSIAMDPLKGIANNMQGNIQLIIEANSGQFISKSDVAVGKGYYFSSVPSLLADFGNSIPKSLLGQMIEFYDAIQGEFVDQYGKKVTASAAAKLFSTDTMFFNMHLGEHEIQVPTMLALMNATNVIDKKTGKTMTLLEAHNIYGAYGVGENTNFTEKKRQDFQNRLHALNKRMHGVYNEFDKGTMQRYNVGRLAVMYRKHLVPGYKRRFKSMTMDHELGTFTEGYYNTFWRLFLKDLVTFKWNMIEGWSTYTPFQKAQMKRAIAEATMILTTTALAGILISMGDDDEEWKDNYAYNFALYEMIRMRSETAAYISPKDAYKVVKSPSAMTSTLERAIRFTDQFFFTWDPEKLTYQKKSGIWEKGDNKSWAYFLKLIGISGYNMQPGEAAESFLGTINK